MRVDLEEKIRKLEEDRHNSDISAGNVHVLSFSVFKYKLSIFFHQKCHSTN